MKLPVHVYYLLINVDKFTYSLIWSCCTFWCWIQLVHSPVNSWHVERPRRCF